MKGSYRTERKQLHSPASGAAVWIFGKHPYTEHPEGAHDPQSRYSIILPRGWASGEKEILDTTGLLTKNRDLGTPNLGMSHWKSCLPKDAVPQEAKAEQGRSECATAIEVVPRHFPLQQGGSRPTPTQRNPLFPQGKEIHRAGMIPCSLGCPGDELGAPNPARRQL